MADAKQFLVIVVALIVGAIIGGLIGYYSLPESSGGPSGSTEAKCQFAGDVNGSVTLKQSGDSVTIMGQVTGLSEGQHGFHIHESGLLGNGCKEARGHFNPFGKNHGAPTDEERHVGDLGNVVSDGSAPTKIEITDGQVSLGGVASVLGRAIVIHSGQDDLGKGGDEGSMKTGNAGSRVACCTISIA